MEVTYSDRMDISHSDQHSSLMGTEYSPVLGNFPLLGDSPVIGDSPLLGDSALPEDSPLLRDSPMLGNSPVLKSSCVWLGDSLVLSPSMAMDFVPIAYGHQEVQSESQHHTMVSQL